MVKVKAKRDFHISEEEIAEEYDIPEQFEEGEEYDIDDEIAEDLEGQELVERTEEVKEEWVRYLVSRGFSRNPEKMMYSKEIEGGKRLVVDFEQDINGRRFGYNRDGESEKGLRDHPDLKCFKLLRDGDVDSPEEAITMAEKETKEDEEKDKGEVVEKIGQEIEIDNGGGQKQAMEVQMEPALELSGEKSLSLLKNMLYSSLDKDGLSRLVWDPQAEPGKVPYDPKKLPYKSPEPTAEAYDLFARIIELATGITYNMKNVDFYMDEGLGTVNCDVLIIREPDGKRLLGYKTRMRESMSGMDHWKERLLTKARRNALRPEIPATWITGLIREYKEKAMPKVRK